MQTITLIEYGSLVCDKEIAGCQSLSKETFALLENFILTQKSDESTASELLSLSVRKGIGKVISAKNHVGVICLTNGITIEILPKIYSDNPDFTTESEIKKLLIRMLKTLGNAPYKNIQTAHLNIEKMNIFEIFIRMFVNEVLAISKKGLKCHYQRVEENQTILKGKLLFSEHIKKNIVHRERNYVEFDEYNTNCPENRLIKTTLKKLYFYTRSIKNKNDIKNLLDDFSLVPSSNNFIDDSSKCISDRMNKDYELALAWCNIFLMKKSFTSFMGTEKAFALLFPMEILFESYVASKLKQSSFKENYAISTQDRGYYLFEEPKRFRLRPDIKLTDKDDKSIILLDTKWKILSENKNNYGISQTDMYQMYAYQKKYDSKKVILVYPKNDTFSENKIMSYFAKEDNIHIDVCFVDLLNIENNIEKLPIQFSNKL